MSKNYELLRPLENRQLKIAEVTPSSRVVKLTTHAPGDDSTPDVFGLLQVLFRRRIWIGISSAAMLAVAALVCLVMTPQYVATSRIQLLNQQSGRLSLKDSNDLASGSDYTTLPVTLQTHVSVVQSDTLALQVIKELNLANTKEFRYDPLIKTEDVRRQMAAPLVEAPLKRSAILKRFKANLSVDSVSGTRLITVSYEDPDPEMAAKIVNQLVSDFLDYNFQVDYNATTKATDFLGRQLVDLKSQVEKSQERAVELQKASGIYGTDEHNNVIVTRLEQLNTELTTAQANRIVKEAVYNLARKGNPELIAGLLGTSANGNASQITNSSLAQIHQLRQQETDLNGQYADAATKYGPAYPRLIEMKERLASLKSSIDTELGKVVQSAGNEYEVATSQEAAARRIFEEQKAVATKMNDRTIDYTIAKREAESAQALYDNLTQKLKEADVLAGLRSSELNIVDAAVVPGRPAKPSVPLYLAVGALAGLMLGVIAAFVVEAMDRTIRNPEEIESTTQMPILGIIPQGRIPPSLEPRDWLKAYGPNGHNGTEDETAGFLSPDHWVVTEAFRQVRTSLMLSWPDHPPKVLMMASAISQEGKSFTSLNLAAALAQNGGKVLLVDADLRRGTLSRIVKQHSAIGLSEALSGNADHDAYRQMDEVPGLVFMPAGALLNSPAELLGSAKMAKLIQGWRAEFSYVVIDTPALLPVTDAVVVSPHVDLVIMVARFAFTQSQSVLRAIRLLRVVQVKHISVLVNAMDPRSREYYPYRGSNGYHGGQYEDPHLLAHRSSTLRAEGGNP
jgi:succinoglycan biosynthesis transport protein ExoP